MIEVIAKVQLLNGAEEDIIGIKDSIAYAVEKWSDLIKFEIKTDVPVQMDFDSAGKIRPTVTTASAFESLKSRNLTNEELRNIMEALIQVSNL